MSVERGKIINKPGRAIHFRHESRFCPFFSLHSSQQRPIWGFALQPPQVAQSALAAGPVEWVTNYYLLHVRQDGGVSRKNASFFSRVFYLLSLFFCLLPFSSLFAFSYLDFYSYYYYYLSFLIRLCQLSDFAPSIMVWLISDPPPNDRVYSP
ncbi:hypothetical protein BO94DRAFT_49928 [Aspergillus sclerotioniger CBS 115572]|uniref:Uncharacterized protein n=1 Tax=Aspergillus sclerotioniger CBS 115572 TaxID=1450535 RepID=A0A317WQQ3_9EURO|nr:hypothetical protein BO94DRAFT_49928 [Aspergillus sclerotioniger CBS 115572]PWY88736.1 hypothetical protein BO94DRAFT_49928 [Aspergillus sclerotioniger CBS 115572]